MVRKKTIGVLGYYGALNLGDELILKAMLELISDHRILVFGEEPDRIKRLHGVQEAYRYDSLPEKVTQLDMLLFGGGGVLHRRYVAKVIPDELMTSTDTPVIVFAAGIPFVDWCEGLEDFLNRCRLITLRESSSLPYLRALTTTPVMFMPDPAFIIPDQKLKKVPGKVAVNIRSIPNSYLRGLPGDADAILLRELQHIISHFQREGRPYSVLGFSPADKEWIEEFGGKLVSCEEAIQEIGTSEFLIGTRLHAGVIAATQGTPALMLSYQRKVQNLGELFPSSLKCVPIHGLDLVKEWSAFQPAKYNSAMLNDLRRTIQNFVDIYINDDERSHRAAEKTPHGWHSLDLEQWRTNLQSRLNGLEQRLAQVQQDAADKVARLQEQASEREAQLRNRIDRQQQTLDGLRQREQQLISRTRALQDKAGALRGRLQTMRRNLYPHRYVGYVLKAALRRLARVIPGSKSSV